jgi:hypothetical protein
MLVSERSVFFCRISAQAYSLPLDLGGPVGAARPGRAAGQIGGILYPLDFRGFGREWLINILKGFVADDLIEPVPAIELPVRDFCAGTFRFRVCNGLHRYYASIAAGFRWLPSICSVWRNTKAR